jgi:hypothetical protein
MRMEATLQGQRVQSQPAQGSTSSTLDEITLRLLSNPNAKMPDGRPPTWNDRILAFRRLAESGRLTTLVPLLPLLLNLNGQPYHLDNHFPFETVFNTHMPEWLLLKTGRQLSKSTGSAARGVVLCNWLPNFKILYITPLYEQIRRFSTNYVRPFIDQSPVKSMWTGTHTENSVLQRTFINQSKMIFSFAYLDADRTRGISADLVSFDEIQDLDIGFIPIIEETLSYSRYGLEMFTGTPKTLDGTVEKLWQSSSQAEWAIPCEGCKHLNFPCRDLDLDKMIGPLPADGVSEHRPGVICSKCEKPVLPRTGRWVHRYENRRWDRPGYHVPQIIMPLHYSDSRKWKRLLGKREGRNNMSEASFYNEVLGESSDLGIKVVTQTDLKRAAVLPWKNDPICRQEPTEAMSHRKDYIARALGVDWGGGGEDEVSFTKLAVVGLRGDGKLDVIFGRMLLNPADHFGEARTIMKHYQQFECEMYAHDYNGAGTVRESLAVQAGLPIDKLVPMVYHPTATQDLMVPHISDRKHTRNFYLLDKARSLLMTGSCIKLGTLRFFQYDFEDTDNPGLLQDFLALMENKVTMPRGRDVYMIIRSGNLQDDFAHAVNFACCALWYRYGWPDLAQAANYRLSEAIMENMPPEYWAEDESGGDPMDGFSIMP